MKSVPLARIPRRISCSAVSAAVLATLLAGCGGGSGGPVVTTALNLASFGGVTDDSQLQINGRTLGGPPIVGITVNGAPATSTDGFRTWSVTAPLELGMNPLVAQFQLSGRKITQSLGSSVERADPFVNRPNHVAWDPTAGRVVVLDDYRHAIVAVDPVTKARTLISGPDRGAGPLPDQSSAVAVDAARNKVYWAGLVAGKAAIVGVDLQTGERGVVSAFPSPGAGTQLYFGDSGMTVDAATGVVYVNGTLSNPQSGLLNNIVAIDPTTGDRTVVASSAPGSGPDFVAVGGVVQDPATGMLYLPATVASSQNLVFVALNPTTGVRSVVVPQATPNVTPTPATLTHFTRGAAFVPNPARIVVGDPQLKLLYSVDLATGALAAVPPTGTPLEIYYTGDLARDPSSGRLFVLTGDRLVAVDLATSATDDLLGLPSRGAGPPLARVASKLVADVPHGRLLVGGQSHVGVSASTYPYGAFSLTAVDLASGDRTQLFGAPDKLITPSVVMHSMRLDPRFDDGSRLKVLGFVYPPAVAGVYKESVFDVDLRTGTVVGTVDVSVATQSGSAYLFPNVAGPVDFVVAANGTEGFISGSFVTPASATQSVWRVDLVTGVATPLPGSDGFLVTQLEMDEGGQRLLRRGEASVSAVDMTTGVESQNVWCASYASPINEGIAVDPQTSAIVACDFGAAGLFAIDLQTGTTSMISAPSAAGGGGATGGRGRGPAIRSFNAVALDAPSRTAFVLTVEGNQGAGPFGGPPYPFAAVCSIDLATGDRVLISR